jgi:plastocyanin
VRALLAVAAALVAPSSAAADATITALPRDRFEPAEVTIDPGERVTFANRDIDVHDVVGDGFRSSRADPGADAQVAGAEALAPGRYAFVCSIHASMRGTLVVRGAPPPPDGEPPAPQPQPQPRDTTGPRVAVRRRGRRLRVSVDEAARIVVRAGGRTLRRSTSGAATARFRLPPRTRRILVTATDAAGNATRVRR